MNDRDWRLVQLVAEGYRLEEIARLEGMGYDNVKALFQRMYQKEGAWTAAELVARGFRKGKIN